MKKIIFLMALIAINLTATAQLRVINNGQVQIGDWTAESAIPITKTSTATILGNGECYSEGTLTFGGREDVVISESSILTFF